MILFRYLTREVLTSLLLITSLLFLILISNEFVHYLNQVAYGKFAANILWKLIVLESPRFLAILLPFSLCLAILFTYGRLYADYEMTVLNACGFSLGQLTRLSLPFIFLLFFIVAGLSLWLSPSLLSYRNKLLTQTGIAIKKEGMGGLLAVAQGSEEPVQFITLEYLGAEKQKPIVLVGKGVTFDAGGICLKPALGMEEMKYDMSGAAAVLGVLKTIAQLELPIHVVGIIPLTENLPSGRAVKPGDVVKTLAGLNVEVINTDAEGRLILADALTYSERFNPAAVIDMATLTGAIIVTLGTVATGMMSNTTELALEIEKAGQESQDRVWPLPLWDDYQEQINSNVADVSNVGIGGGKSITAACFLSRFTKKLNWAHLDIAGTAWKSGPEKTATGRPVSLIVQFLLNRCKNNNSE